MKIYCNKCKCKMETNVDNYAAWVNSIIRTLSEVHCPKCGTRIFYRNKNKPQNEKGGDTMLENINENIQAKEIEIYEVTDRVHDYYVHNAPGRTKISKYILQLKLSAQINNATYTEICSDDPTKMKVMFGNLFMMVDTQTKTIFWIDWRKAGLYISKERNESLKRDYQRLGLSKTGNTYAYRSSNQFIKKKKEYLHFFKWG